MKLPAGVREQAR
jgi:hypothetical protein